MSRQLIVRPRAKRESDSSIELYESRVPGLGQELRDHILAIFHEIKNQPNRFPLATRITRKATIIKFKFDVYYRETKSGDIIVVSIYHQSRKPDGWKGRK